MKATTLISIAGLSFGPIFAFTIPRGQPDGIFSVYIDANGTETHSRLAYASTTIPSTFSTISKRSRLAETYLANCWGRDLDHDATDTANADLDQQCNSGVSVGRMMSIYAKRGGVVAFACNRRSAEPQRCFAQGRDICSQRITNKCGRYVSGECWADPDVWGPGNPNYGYAEDTANFC
jgi:hypothetical protein